MFWIFCKSWVVRNLRSLLVTEWSVWKEVGIISFNVLLYNLPVGTERTSVGVASFLGKIWIYNLLIMAHSTTVPWHIVNPEGELRDFFRNYATDPHYGCETVSMLPKNKLRQRQWPKFCFVQWLMDFIHLM